MKWLGLILCGVILAGCQWWSQPGGTDDQGNKTPPTTGIVDQAANAAATAGGLGVPYAGLAGWVLSMIGAAGMALTAKKRKDDEATTVDFVDVLKEKAAGFKSDKDVERLIKTFSASNPKWGKRLKKAWAKARSLK